ncbi:hypothetical protein [Sphingomonas sp. UYP23]
MIDNLALAISHGLIALTIWRLLRRPDLDRETVPGEAPVRKRKGRPLA